MANPQPTDAHIRIAHSITEAIMTRDFSKRQRKILDLILRLSWGCGKKTATIPHQKDFQYVGVQEGHIKKELEWLIDSKIITREGNSYSFVKDFELWQISRNKPYQPEKVTELVSMNLKELTKTVSENLLKGEDSTYQKMKFLTSDLASVKESIKESVKENIYTLPDWINKETWAAFLQMRKKIKKEPTEKAIDLIIRALEKIKDGGDDPNQVLEKSIINNWRDVFPLNRQPKGGNGNGSKQNINNW
jgi:hypothetical protein